MRVGKGDSSPDPTQQRTEKLMEDSNEAISLILRILNLANPHPPEKAAERVQQMRDLLSTKKERKLDTGFDRQAKGGRNREG
jgi:hypothetical protein